MSQTTLTPCHSCKQGYPIQQLYEVEGYEEILICGPCFDQEPSTSEEQVAIYVGKDSCGCMLAASVDRRNDDTARDVGYMVMEDLAVERITSGTVTVGHFCKIRDGAHHREE